MKRGLLCGLLLSLLYCGVAGAGGYSFVKADDFKTWLQEGKKMTIIDIQPAADFRKQHFRGSIETNAYPVKSADERGRLDKAVALLAASGEEVVVVCPRGGGGAKGAYDYLKSRGISEKRLRILEGGIQGWPYQGLTVVGK